MKKIIVTSTIVSILLLFAGCGQKGPLYRATESATANLIGL